MATLIVLTGGNPASPLIADRLPEAGMVIAADSGLENAFGLGLHVDLVVGDFDSVDRSTLEEARAAGARIEQHPEAKDRTDLAIALDAALEQAPARVIVVGGHGGRLDHLLANALLLASPAYAKLRIDAFMGTAHVHVVRDEARLEGIRGELISLLPAHGPAHGVSTTGLLYRLDRETLASGSSRGVSNEFVDPHATVSVEKGCLLAVQPGALGTHVRSGIFD